MGTIEDPDDLSDGAGMPIPYDHGVAEHDSGGSPALPDETRASGFQVDHPFGTADRVATLRAGDYVGGADGKRFQIIERLGAGSMGSVHLAHDGALDRTVALKFITCDSAGASATRVGELFTLEARLTARLAHENIVRIFDIGNEWGVPFLVMEHLEGRGLDSRLASEEWEALRATRIMADVARGLAHAHRFGVVHRDLKPSNIFVLKDGRAKILDFGLAGLGTLAAGESSTVAGTPSYMAPEQWLGLAHDGRADIWAAGVIFFEMLTGRRPFVEPSLDLLCLSVTSSAPAPSVRLLRPDLPEEAEQVIGRALEKDTARRFGTAEQFLDALVGLEVRLTRTVQAHHASRMARPRPERRQVTVFSCALADLMGSAERMEPENFSELLNAFFETCATVVRQLEGTLVSHTGGRSVACFGYPVAHEDDAQRAVRAAFLVSEAVQRIEVGGIANTAVQIGIHTGVAVVGRLSGDDPEAPSVIQGDVPEITAWLERRANPGQILLTQRTQLLLRGLFELQSLGLHSPEGARNAVEIFEAIRVRDAMSRFAPARLVGLTPLVGREAEVRRLGDGWQQAKQGRGQFVLIAGDAGMGKSRLVEVLREQVASESHTWLTAQCWSHFRHSALHPLVDCLLRSTDIRHEMAPAEKSKKLEAALSSLRLPIADLMPVLATFLNIPLSPPYEPVLLSPEQFKNRLLEALTAMLLALAARQPALFVVEDLHWSDASTLELLDLLVARVSTAPLMIVGTFRPEFQPPWPDRPHVCRLTIQRLSPSNAAAMVALATQGRQVAPEILAHLASRSDGVPLFIEELARTVLETDTSQPIPASLHELLLARLDRLSGAGKEVAQLGAVLGREFTYELIRRASNLDESALRDGLMRLVDAGLLRRHGQLGDVRYVFKHALIQESAYGSLTRAQQREHHRRAAEVLGRDFAEIADAQPELLAHHHTHAGEDGRAIGYLEKAGRLAARRSALTDAQTHYRRALQLLGLQPASEARDRDELRLHLGLGAPLMATLGYAHPEVRETYNRARDLCQRAGDDAQLFESLLGLWFFYMVSGEVAICTDLGRQLLGKAEKHADPVTLMLAHRALGTSLMLGGEFQACRDHTEQGARLYDRREHGRLAFKFGQDPGVMNMVYMAWSLWYLGYADQAAARAEQALELARAIQHPVSTTLALDYLALVRNYRGEHQRAVVLAEEAMDIAVEHRLQLWQAMSRIQQGWGLLGLGDRSRGGDLLKAGVSGWTQTGARAGLSFFLASLVWSQWRAGALDEAMATIEELEEFIRQKGELFVQAELLRLRGEVTLQRGPDTEREAEAFFLRGLEIARRQNARAWELRLVTSLAPLWARRGERHEAKRLVESSLNRFTEGFETADFRRARDLLESLSDELRA